MGTSMQYVPYNVFRSVRLEPEGLSVREEAKMRQGELVRTHNSILMFQFLKSKRRTQSSLVRKSLPRRAGYG